MKAWIEFGLYLLVLGYLVGLLPEPPMVWTDWKLRGIAYVVGMLIPLLLFLWLRDDSERTKCERKRKARLYGQVAAIFLLLLLGAAVVHGFLFDGPRVGRGWTLGYFAFLFAETLLVTAIGLFGNAALYLRYGPEPWKRLTGRLKKRVTEKWRRFRARSDDPSGGPP